MLLAAVAADHPELSFGEVGRKLGELWKALNEEDRKAYNGEKEIYTYIYSYMVPIAADACAWEKV